MLVSHLFGFDLLPFAPEVFPLTLQLIGLVFEGAFLFDVFKAYTAEWDELLRAWMTNVCW